MLQSQDFKELLSILEKHRVRYLVIGGYAVMLYSEPRWTKDLDIWIAIDAANGPFSLRCASSERHWLD